jgi:uncharacterized protein
MPTFDILGNRQYMALTTFRKSGAAVKTPVWFARDGDRLIVYTDPTSGKIKRIRNNPRVTVTPCTFNGKLLSDEVAEGQARILPESEWEAASAQMVKKYGLLYRIFRSFEKLRRAKEVFVAITPA